MENRSITSSDLQHFSQHLIREEKSQATQEKYLRDVRGFVAYAGQQPVTKELVMGWKRQLMERGYAVRSINSMLASVNSFVEFMGWETCKVKSIRLQRQTYCPEDKELSKEEYIRLLNASRNNYRLNMILQTICATGIRVSELQYFTVETVRAGEVTVNCKGKNRTILVPGKLKKLLLSYAKSKCIRTGTIFVDKSGNPLDRSYIWRLMKQLCQAAGVAASKVFPHNLRKLFARTFYKLEKDIAKLADILGHGSINTTRIYLMSTGSEHRRKIERLGLTLNLNLKRVT